MSKTALLLMDLQNGIVDRFCNDTNFISDDVPTMVAALPRLAFNLIAKPYITDTY
jgi:hypothetical protein